MAEDEDVPTLEEFQAQGVPMRDTLENARYSEIPVGPLVDFVRRVASDSDGWEGREARKLLRQE